MATSKKQTETRGNELYLKYLLLLGKATPVALKVVIEDIEQKQQKSLTSIIEERTETLCNDYNETYEELFKEHTVNTRIESWDISVVCDLLHVVFVLLGDTDHTHIQCIREHIKDIESYTESASLDFKTFKEKWDSLLEAINELIGKGKGKDQYDCKRLIHSYGESTIKVSKGLIEQMKQTKDLNEHIDIAKMNESSLMLDSKDIGSIIDGSEIEICNTTERTEQDLEIIEHLHVVEEDIKKDRKITLACKVNKDGTKPKWFHNGKIITPCPRLLGLSQGQEHKLIIQRARVDDGGEYLVVFNRAACHKCIIVKDDFDLGLKYQLTKKEYRNWVKGVLGLKYLKLGLENVSENEVKKHHDNILRSLQFRNQCNLCNEGNLRLNRKKNKSSEPKRCPTGGYCTDFYDLIVRGHRYKNPCIKNTEIERWGSEPWSVATCYISTPGYKGKKNASEVDCAGLLCLFINNNTYLPSVGLNVFEMARTTRNDILHNPNYELSVQMLKAHLKKFKEVLKKVKEDQSVDICAKRFIDNCIQELKKLKTHQIDINIDEELQKLKDHAMQEDADMIKRATEQKETELKHFEKRLEQTGEELKLIGRLRSTHMKPKKLLQKIGIRPSSTQVSLDLEFHIMIYVRGKDTGSSKKTIKRVYDFMSDVVDYITQKNATKPHYYNEGTGNVICDLLQTICMNEETLVQRVNFEPDTGVSLKIKCSSSLSIEKVLVVSHGNEFQNRIQYIKTCLAEEEKDWKTEYDIEASCSLGSIQYIRKELEVKGILEGTIYDYRCEKHDGTLKTWYCCDDDTFCCSSCMENNHRSCPRLKQVISNSTYNNVIKSSLYVKDKPNKYDVQHRRENDTCEINSLCILPNGDILLCDTRNSSLKKLNTSYKLISHIKLTSGPRDMCYIGNGKAVVLMKVGDSLSKSCKLEFVKVCDLRTERSVPLDHYVDCLACHGDTLYTCVQDTVRLCKTDGTQESVLCKIQSTADTSTRYMAVSHDGEKIYITNEGCLTVMDHKGNNLYSFMTKKLNIPSGVCCVEDGSVLVCDAQSHSILQVDTMSKKVIGTVVETPSYIEPILLTVRPKVLCYDRKHSRLVVGCNDSHYISVYDLKKQNECTV